MLEQRLASGADVSIDDAQASVERLKAALVEPQVVGDIDGTAGQGRAARPAARRPTPSRARAEDGVARGSQGRARARSSSEAEALADSTSWKATGDRLKALLDEWKAAPHVDRGGRADAVEALLRGPELLRPAPPGTLRQARDRAGGRPRRPRRRWSPRRSQARGHPPTGRATANEMRKLMDRWKAAGRAGRAADEQLWQGSARRRTSSIEARSAALAERDADLVEEPGRQGGARHRGGAAPAARRPGDREGGAALHPGALGEDRSRPARRPGAGRGTAQAGRAGRPRGRGGPLAAQQPRGPGPRAGHRRPARDRHRQAARSSWQRPRRPATREGRSDGERVASRPGGRWLVEAEKAWPTRTEFSRAADARGSKAVTTSRPARRPGPR